MESGSVFSDANQRAAMRVAILGMTTARNLFGEEDPTGKTVRIKNSPFLVVGSAYRQGPEPGRA